MSSTNDCWVQKCCNEFFCSYPDVERVDPQRGGHQSQDRGVLVHELGLSDAAEKEKMALGHFKVP